MAVPTSLRIPPSFHFLSVLEQQYLTFEESAQFHPRDVFFYVVFCATDIFFTKLLELSCSGH